MLILVALITQLNDAIKNKVLDTSNTGGQIVKPTRLVSETILFHIHDSLLIKIPGSIITHVIIVIMNELTVEDVKHTTVRCRYRTVNFHTYPHNRFPLVNPSVRGMGSPS